MFLLFFFIRLQALCWLHFNRVIMIFFIGKLSFYLYTVTVFSELSCNTIPCYLEGYFSEMLCVCK